MPISIPIIALLNYSRTPMSPLLRANYLGGFLKMRLISYIGLFGGSLVASSNIEKMSNEYPMS
jgi:hypothetical protein